MVFQCTGAPNTARMCCTALLDWQSRLPNPERSQTYPDMEDSQIPSLRIGGALAHTGWPAAPSSEPPASVGLACGPVGACRRHLVKRSKFMWSRCTPLTGWRTFQHAPLGNPYPHAAAATARCVDRCAGRRARKTGHATSARRDPRQQPTRVLCRRQRSGTHATPQTPGNQRNHQRASLRVSSIPRQ